MSSSSSSVGARMRRSVGRLRRRTTSKETWWLVFLVAVTVFFFVLVTTWPRFWPLTLLVLPMVAAHLVLGPRVLPWFVVFNLAALTALSVVVTTRLGEVTAGRVIAVAVIFAVGFIVLLTSFRRSRLGVAGTIGESMLVDLRDRIMSQGMLPALPPGWYAESALRSAGGTPFAGDFVVAARPGWGRRLELCVCDVSGKGEEAGTRALLLTGAFGGLITSLPPGEFLPAANEYLLRQHWIEGFATAIHISVDLESGDFELRSAGHPPALQLNAGSGRWTVHESEGPALGLIEEADYAPVRGRLNHGDAILLYTDGMVEVRGRDIQLGIDKMLGQADRLLQQGFENGARRLIDTVGTRNDDRALLLVHRR
ncbi:serine/threonine-protein phosphatase [Nocardioides guangzhouensis]|uniref:Serine/threonine-protein phosphatase n=1 Tax=Nocardioides guangzhouensis TaxID=2497878 RepID=A0A4Q4ZN79_9ACTN|nr:PP2C family protein-serine/threonine phosphatase [Nocardioides guangzhouensis]RYP89111.1 serine/threonine-protein phosphatase [Nocardioides guangzhouensis]